jgi:hypothetical protein
MSISSLVSALYESILGRPADPAGLAGYVAAIDGGDSVAQVALAIASSPESQGNLQNLYESELGRAPDQVGLASFTNALAAGVPLSAVRAEVAASPEAQADIDNLYTSVLGRVADSGGLAYFTQLLAGGASLADVKMGLANSAEITNDVTGTYVALTGQAPNPVELAAYHAELASGATYSLVQTELHQLTGGAPPQHISLILTGVPETIALSGPNLVYSVLNNDALIASAAEKVTLIYGGTSGVVVLPDFNPATDILQIQTSQDASFAKLSFVAAGAATIVQLGGGGELILSNTSESALQAANFRFV